MTGLDKLLGGGIAAGIVTDIFGAGGSGKTQLAMQICVGAIGGKIIFQDPRGSFRPERILQLMQARTLGAELLDNIIVARPTNTAEQIGYLEKISQIRPTLVVMDDITDLFSFEYSREENLLEKHITFMKYMRSVSLLGIQNKIPIVVTNAVRGTGSQQRENLDKSISIFTHKKIKLLKEEHRFVAEVLPSFGTRKEIAYKIVQEGLREEP